MRNPHSLSHSTQLSRLAYSTKSVTMETIFYGSLPTIHSDIKSRIPFENVNQVVYCMLYIHLSTQKICVWYQFSKYQNPSSHEKNNSKSKNFEVKTSLKNPRRFLFGLYYWKKSQFSYLHPRNWLFFEWDSQK